MYFEVGKQVLKAEGEALLAQANLLGADFDRAVELILGASGRVVVTGIGKAGLIGRKVSATFASTGTPSFFLHPAEGIHGDLGMVTGEDLVLALSNSGESDEVSAILPTLKILGTKIIALTSNPLSTLGKNADLILRVAVESEACPLNLAPTTSTTLLLSIGDALAVALLNAKSFKAEDFALFHPGGALGRRLLLTVEKVMVTGEENPVIREDQLVKEAIFEITDKKKGATSVVNEVGRLVGIVTDGDLRRHFERNSNPLACVVSQMMTKSPKTITGEKMAAEAIHIMEKNNITVLPVVDGEKHPIGLVHLHDLLKGMTGLK